MKDVSSPQRCLVSARSEAHEGQAGHVTLGALALAMLDQKVSGTLAFLTLAPDHIYSFSSAFSYLITQSALDKGS